MNKKEVITFRKPIQPNEKIEFIERIKADGVIESIKIRFYMGQELQLKVLPYIKHRGNKIEYMTTNPINNGDYSLAGDDDYFMFDVAVPVRYDDELLVKVENLSNEYIYNLSCDITIDYLGGTDRIIGGVVR